MLIEIKSRFDSRVIFSHDCENNTVRLTFEDAVRIRANLTGAYLTRAYLDGANLTGAYLTRAYLDGANLTGANLTGANLTGANLTRANLTRANLTEANLTGANLTRATYGIATLTKGILQILGLYWPVLIFDAHIKIGCEFHSTQEWTDFTDDEISNMDSHASEFWKKNRDMILLAARTHQQGG